MRAKFFSVNPLFWLNTVSLHVCFLMQRFYSSIVCCAVTAGRSPARIAGRHLSLCCRRFRCKLRFCFFLLTGFLCPEGGGRVAHLEKLIEMFMVTFFSRFFLTMRESLQNDGEMYNKAVSCPVGRGV